MASSGVIYGSRAVDAYGPRLELHWSLTSQDVANNKSTIKVVSYVDMKGYVNYGVANSGSTTAQDTKSYSYTPSSATALRRQVATTYHTVTHAGDGTLTLTLKGSYTFTNLTWNGSSVGTINASGSITLNQILRGLSNISLASGWDSITGNKTITFTKLSTSSTVQLKWQYWNLVTKSWSSIVTQSSNYSSGTGFSFADAQITSMHTNRPNSTFVYMRIILETYIGGKLITTDTRYVEPALKEDSPTVNATVVCEGFNQSLLGNSLYGVQDVHAAKITVSGTAKNGASIVSYKVTCEGRAYSTTDTTKAFVVVTNKIKTAGTVPVVVSVTDSRGLVGTKQFNLTIRTYTPPSALFLSETRIDSSGNETPLGTRAKISGGIAYTTQVLSASGTNVNQPLWNIKVDSTNASYSTSTINHTVSVPIEQTKDYTLMIGDKFSYTTIKRTIPVGQAPLILGKAGIGINTLPPTGGLSGAFISGELEINGMSLSRLVDFSSSCSINNAGVNTLTAYKYGRICYINFKFKPRATGFTTSIITIPAPYRPTNITGGSVNTSLSLEDMTGASYSVYMLQGGYIGFVATKVPKSDLICTFIYMTND